MPGLAEIIRLRTVDCRQAADYLPLLAAADPAADSHSDDHDLAAAADHLARCLRCQAELVAYRRILRHLRGLRHDEVRSPPGGLAAVLASLQAAALEEQAVGANRVWRVARLGGITVATAAATTAGVLVWMSRRRPGLAETG
jgi:hypothetical protein